MYCLSYEVILMFSRPSIWFICVVCTFWLFCVSCA